MVCLLFAFFGVGGGTGWTLTPGSVSHRKNTIMSRARLGNLALCSMPFLIFYIYNKRGGLLYSV